MPARLLARELVILAIKNCRTKTLLDLVRVCVQRGGALTPPPSELHSPHPTSLSTPHFEQAVPGPPYTFFICPLNTAKITIRKKLNIEKNIHIKKENKKRKKKTQ